MFNGKEFDKLVWWWSCFHVFRLKLAAALGGKKCKSVQWTRSFSKLLDWVDALTSCGLFLNGLLASVRNENRFDLISNTSPYVSKWSNSNFGTKRRPDTSLEIPEELLRRAGRWGKSEAHRTNLTENIVRLVPKIFSLRSATLSSRPRTGRK